MKHYTITFPYKNGAKKTTKRLFTNIQAAREYALHYAVEHGYSCGGVRIHEAA